MKGEHDNEAPSPREEAVTPQPGPGSRLAKARAAANLSIEQVATSLNLTVGVVTALERDDPDQLPAPVFVRGYLKNYARLVGLRGDELVAQYETSRAPDVPLELRPRPVSEAPSRGIGVSPRAVVTVLVLVVIGLAAWWWIQGGRIDLAGLTSGAPSAPSTAPAPVAIAPIPAPLPPPAEPVVAAPVAPAEPVLPPPEQTASAAQGGMLAPTEPVAAPEPMPAPEPPPPAPTGHTLSLALSDDVWVEVVDDDGSRLVFDMLRSGTRRQVTGEGPFLVLLGKAGAVQVELDGRRVDHSAYENKGIARFVLDDREGEIVTRAP